jgi:hypothetical protein
MKLKGKTPEIRLSSRWENQVRKSVSQQQGKTREAAAQEL